MKMQLLTISILLSLVGCCKRNDLIRINKYEFHSLYSFGKEVKICSDVDVVHNIIESKKIKGPVIGIDVMTLVLINKKEKGDTLKVIIYGKDCRYFRIGNDYYESKNSILDKVQNWEVSK